MRNQWKTKSLSVSLKLHSSYICNALSDVSGRVRLGWPGWRGTSFPRFPSSSSSPWSLLGRCRSMPVSPVVGRGQGGFETEPRRMWMKSRQNTTKTLGLPYWMCVCVCVWKKYGSMMRDEGRYVEIGEMGIYRVMRREGAKLEEGISTCDSKWANVGKAMQSNKSSTIHIYS